MGGETGMVELFNILSKLATSETLFAILFLTGLVLVGRYVVKSMGEFKAENVQRENQLIEIYKEQLTKSATRESELMANLEKNTEQLAIVAGTLRDIQVNLEKLEYRVEDNFHDVWKELGNKADKVIVQHSEII